LLAWCSIAKTYRHPPLHAVALPAVLQPLPDPFPDRLAQD